jgi:hypothetical protein
MGLRKTEKSFDSVKLMREIRDRLSHQIEGMSFEEQKQYIRERLDEMKHQSQEPHEKNTPTT